jgi:hypothetical protein
VIAAAERAALEHENWIAYLTGVAGCAGTARVHREGGALAVLSDMPFDWFNQVLVDRPDASARDVLACVEHGRARGGSFVVRLREGADDRFVPLLTRSSFVPAGDDTFVPGMVAAPIDLASMENALAPSGLPGFEIRKVTDATGIDEHRTVVTEGFGSHPSIALGTTCAELLGRTECVVYVGYAEGAPVASGLGWRSGRAIGVYAIATVPAARRLGYGAAMTSRVVMDGLAAGCDLAVLQASVVGRPIYERLGFRVEVRYRAYVR